MMRAVVSWCALMVVACKTPPVPGAGEAAPLGPPGFAAPSPPPPPSSAQPVDEPVPTAIPEEPASSAPAPLVATPGTIACGQSTCEVGKEMCCADASSRCYTLSALAADLASRGIDPKVELCRVPPRDIDTGHPRWCDDMGDCPQGKVCCDDGDRAKCGAMPCDAICSGDGGCPAGYACRNAQPGYPGDCEPETAKESCRRHSDCGDPARRCCISYTGRSHCTTGDCSIAHDYTEACDTVATCRIVYAPGPRKATYCNPELGRCEYSDP